MTTQTDAYPELARVRQFFPLGVDQPTTLSRAQIEHFNEKGYIFPLTESNARISGLLLSLGSLLSNSSV